MKKYGIDISRHQGDIDLNAIKDSIDFVIIRAGYATTVDEKFERNYNLCKSLNIPVGAYWYSYALNNDDAKKEADTFKGVLANKAFQYPVYVDMEDADGYKEKHGYNYENTKDIVTTFCEDIQNAGYFTGIYANKSWWDNYLKDVNAYTKWVAEWGSNNGLEQRTYQKGILQYTSKKTINGHFGYLDADVCYEDFPSIIRNAKLNNLVGNAATTSLPKPVSAPSSVGFLGARGYFKVGDTNANIGKISSFMYRVFPKYTKKAALGNYYGNSLRASVMEFQRRTGLARDGLFGPKTLAKLEGYGFKA